MRLFEKILFLFVCISSEIPLKTLFKMKKKLNVYSRITIAIAFDVKVYLLIVRCYFLGILQRKVVHIAIQDKKQRKPKRVILII